MLESWDESGCGWLISWLPAPSQPGRMEHGDAYVWGPSAPPVLCPEWGHGEHRALGDLGVLQGILSKGAASVRRGGKRCQWVQTSRIAQS